MVIKKAYRDLISNLPNEQLDADVALDAILPQSPRGSTLSGLDSRVRIFVFAESKLEITVCSSLVLTDVWILTIRTWTKRFR